MVTTLSTCAFFTKVLPASTYSTKSLITFPVMRNTYPGSKCKVNVQSSSNDNVTELAMKDDSVAVDQFFRGRFLEDSLVFSQKFSIRSYEVGADGKASIETIMNLLQETACNHLKGIELLELPVGMEEHKRNLIWVIAKMQVIVDQYPLWCDVVKVDSWVTASGKNGVRREWLVRDFNTGDMLLRASSLWVLMNTKTRKVTKIPVDMREHLEGSFVNCPLFMDMDSRKIPKLDTAHSIRTGITPSWNDLDMNQHVNNVKYVNWIVESVPLEILKTHKLIGMRLEYRRECMIDSELQSLTSIVENGSDETTKPDFTECHHFLCLESGEEILMGTTKWEHPNPQHDRSWNNYSP